MSRGVITLNSRMFLVDIDYGIESYFAIQVSWNGDLEPWNCFPPKKVVYDLVGFLSRPAHSSNRFFLDDL